MKFLLLRFSSIGDIVPTTPVIRCLKKKYPDAEIHFATKQAFASLLHSNPYIDKLHLLGDSDTVLRRQTKQEAFDYVIDLHHNQRTALIKMQLQAKAFSYEKLNLQKWLLVNLKWNWLPKQHIVDRYLATCATLNVVNDGLGLDYFIPKEDEVDLDILPSGFKNGYISWAIGAQHFTKRLPGKGGKCASRFSSTSCFGGKEVLSNAEKIRSLSYKSNLIFNAAGRFTIHQSASLVKQSNLVVSNDTGLMHIAAALKKPVVSIWGNTIPGFGMTPYYEKYKIPSVIIENLELKCRPCSKIGKTACPQSHFHCMTNLDEKKLVAAIEKLLQ